MVRVVRSSYNFFSLSMCFTIRHGKRLGQRLGSCNVSSRSRLRRSRAHPWYLCISLRGVRNGAAVSPTWSASAMSHCTVIPRRHAHRIPVSTASGRSRLCPCSRFDLRISRSRLSSCVSRSVSVWSCRLTANSRPRLMRAHVSVVILINIELFITQGPMTWTYHAARSWRFCFKNGRASVLILNRTDQHCIAYVRLDVCIALYAACKPSRNTMIFGLLPAAGSCMCSLSLCVWSVVGRAALRLVL